MLGRLCVAREIPAEVPGPVAPPAQLGDLGSPQQQRRLLGQVEDFAEGGDEI